MLCQGCSTGHPAAFAQLEKVCVLEPQRHLNRMMQFVHRRATTPSTCMPTRIFRLNVLHTSCAYKLLVATAVTLAFTTTSDVAVARDNAWFTYGPTIQLRNTYLGTSTTLPGPAECAKRLNSPGQRPIGVLSPNFLFVFFCLFLLFFNSPGL